MNTTSAAQAPERERGWVTPVIALAVVGIALVFAFKGTDSTTWFRIFKIVHVGVAMFWVGGGLLITVLAMRAERAGPEELVGIARQAAFAGEKLFAPASGVVLAMGIAMVINQHIGFGTTWVDIGLAGFAVTTFTGIFILSPLTKKILSLSETHGPTAPETQEAVRRILVIARVDVAMLLVVVFDMLMKPFS